MVRENINKLKAVDVVFISFEPLDKIKKFAQKHQLLEKIKPNCAIFFISHRLNTLKNYADNIYILDNKTITHSGSHDSLMQSDNFYSNFWKII